LVCRSRLALSTLVPRLPVFLPSPWRSGLTRVPPLMRFRPSIGPTPDDLAFVRHKVATPAPLLGFPAVRRIRSAGVHIPPEIPPPGYGPTSGFVSPLAGLLLLRPCGFISPRKRPSASPYRDLFLSRRGGCSSHSALPPCRYPESPPAHSRGSIAALRA